MYSAKRKAVRSSNKSIEPGGRTERKDNFMFMDPSDGGGDYVRQFSLPTAKDKVFYLYGEIEDLLDYVDMIHAIRYAEQDQTIMIHINSPGGCLNTCLSLINAIKASPAQVVTIMDGEASSAAAMIWLAGHTKALASKNVTMMLHQAGWKMGGKIAEFETVTKSVKQLINGLMDDLAGKILTAEEVSDFHKGIDVYLHGSEILKRTKGSVDNVQEEIAKEMAELDSVLDKHKK